MVKNLWCTACFCCTFFLVACDAAEPSLDLPREEGSATDADAVDAVFEEGNPLEDLLFQVPPVYTIDAFSRMRLEGKDLELVRVLADNAAYTRHEIAYQSNGLRISGILNIPKGEGPFPLLILNHGYIDPKVYTNGRGLKREQDYLARQGFAVLHTDYRGHASSDPSPDTRNMYDAALEYAMDSANAIFAVRDADLPTVDATRVGMLGHSMGGGVTLNILVARPGLVDAAALYAPVHADAWENFNRWRRMREEGDNTLLALGTREENPTGWDGLSAQAYLDNVQAPILVFHGSNDRDVPQEWSDDLLARLTELEKEAEYVEYAGEGHEFGPQWNDFMRRTAEFFKERVAGSE